MKTKSSKGTTQIEFEAEESEPTLIDLPIQAKQGWFRRTLNFRQNKLDKEIPKEDLPKGNLALIIDENLDGKILENVKEGTLKVKRTVKGEQKEVEISIPRSKLVNVSMGDQSKQMWVISTAEAVALPNNDTKHDSYIIKRLIDALRLNYKDLDNKGFDLTKVAIIGFILITILLLAYILFFRPPGAEVTVQVSGEAIKEAITAYQQSGATSGTLIGLIRG